MKMLDPNNESFLIFTSNFQGTSGNISAARTLIEQLAKSKPNTDFFWIVYSDNTLNHSFLDSLPNNITVKKVDSWDELKNQDLQDICSKANRLLCFPEVRSSEELIQKLPIKKKSNLVVCAQYDHNEFLADQKILAEKKGSEVLVKDKSSYQFSSGFGDNALGIIIPETHVNKELSKVVSFPINNNAVKSLFGSDAVNLNEKDLSLRTAKYFEDHRFYFGYFNKKDVARRGLISPSTFSYLAISDAIKSGTKNKTVDLFCQFSRENDYPWAYKNELEILVDLIEKSDLKDKISLEVIDPNEAFDQKSIESAVSLFSGEDDRKIKIRIINVFPISLELVRYLQSHAEPLLGCTGDQSLTEVLIQEKLAMYEVMAWKGDLCDAFLGLLKKRQGCETLLNFYTLVVEKHNINYQSVIENKQKGNSTKHLDDLNKIIEFYNENKRKLLDEAKIFSHYLCAEKSLTTNLTKKLDELYSHEIKLITEIFGNQVDSVSRYFHDEQLKVNDSINSLYQTSLHLAAQFNSADVLEYLIKSGADVDQKDGLGFSALEYSIEYKAWDVLEKLIESNAKITGSVAHSLFMEQNIPHEILRLAIQHGTDVNSMNSRKQTLLMIAAEKGFLDKVSFLFENGADINLLDSNGNTALSLAIENNHIQVVDFLIKKSANINFLKKNDDPSLLLSAIRNCHETMALRLLDEPFDFDINEVDPDNPANLLMWAISNDLNTIAIKLIEKSANIHYKTRGGNVVLSLALKKGNEIVAAKLIEYGAKIDVKNNQNKTPIDIANDSNQSQLASKIEALSKQQERMAILRLSGKALEQENIAPSVSQSPNLKQKK